MPNTPNASFIPKQGPAKHSRYVASQQLHIVTIISYVLFIATLVSAGGLFFYTKYLNTKLNKEVEVLNNDIAGFSDSDMNDVREFNVRLGQATNRLNKSVSLKAVFDALEAATAQSVQIGEFDLSRNGDDDYDIKARLITDSFDSSLFQRGLFEGSKVAKTVSVTDVTIGTGTNKTSGVSFVAHIGVPLSSVPYTVTDTVSVATTSQVTTASSTTQEVIATTSASSSKTKKP
jgi:hypothetical protein